MEGADHGAKTNGADRRISQEGDRFVEDGGGIFDSTQFLVAFIHLEASIIFRYIRYKWGPLYGKDDHWRKATWGTKPNLWRWGANSLRMGSDVRVKT